MRGVEQPVAASLVDWTTSRAELRSFEHKFVYWLLTSTMALFIAAAVWAAFVSKRLPPDPTSQELLNVIRLLSLGLVVLPAVAIPLYLRKRVPRSQTTEGVRRNLAALNGLIDLLVSASAAQAALFFGQFHDNADSLVLTALGPIGVTIIAGPWLDRWQMRATKRTWEKHHRPSRPHRSVTP